MSTIEPVGKRSCPSHTGEWIAVYMQRPTSNSGRTIQLDQSLHRQVQMIRRISRPLSWVYDRDFGYRSRGSYKWIHGRTRKGYFWGSLQRIIQNGSQVQVAVKKLRCVKQDGDEEFQAEVNVIGKTHHKNLVRLLGYCDEGQQRLLVYELLSNGTLASFLFADVKPSWGQRIKIAFGIAKGLEYLHEECSTPIIHCDIKPQNILLDDNCTARIADFGLAKLLMMNQSHTHTAIRGTKGYVAPEWFRNMPITTKVDEKRRCGNNCEGKAILTNWVYDCYQEGKIDAVLDHETEALHDKKNLEKSVMVAIWCIQEDPSLRPDYEEGCADA
ncbi:receptor-like protein kinase 1 [Prunus dulcis]|uniref:non-specific serine/threonine protein kinase n=1 Tax=Prunus dulcis TaxID=3755 RepID=A0A4Y1RJ49_PRUDU|nr:receptor-like protein kinase 1 [Prunus dulcis]